MCYVWFSWLFDFEVACCVCLLFGVLTLAYGLFFVFVACMFVGWILCDGLLVAHGFVVLLGCLLLVGLFRRVVGVCVFAIVFVFVAVGCVAFASEFLRLGFTFCLV